MCVRVSECPSPKIKFCVGLRNTHEKIQLSFSVFVAWSGSPDAYGGTCNTHYYIYDEFCLSHFAYWRFVFGLTLANCVVGGGHLALSIFGRGDTRNCYQQQQRRRRPRWRFPFSQFSFFTRVAAYRSRSCSLSWCCPENNSNFYFVPNKSVCLCASIRHYCARWTGGEWSKLEKHITYIYGRREEEDWQSKPHTHILTHLHAMANVYIDKRRWLWIFLPSRNVTEAVCGLVWARDARALVERESKRMMRLDIGHCHTSGVNVLWARCADAGLMCAQSF